MDRRSFVAGSIALASAAATPSLFSSDRAFAQSAAAPPSKRPEPGKRKFVSTAVDERIAQVKKKIRNPQLAWLFENCYPNTLDTTVDFSTSDGQPDTFVITGDIDAMWLRDSTAQTTPYLSLVHLDPHLREMYRGLMRRQARCILIDPYANAFYSSARYGEWKDDETTMKPGVHERKWEIDSLCYPIRLAYLYWQQTHDPVPFTAEWSQAAHRIVETFRVEQRITADSPYRFARKATSFTDNAPNDGRGNPTRKIGLIHSAFRPSDDSCLFPFLVPSNMFARTSLDQLAVIAREVLHDASLESSAKSLSAQLAKALEEYAITEHPKHGRIFAYEIDGYGNRLWMDDANAPGLVSLAYLGCLDRKDSLYQNTRNFALSEDNPYYMRGKYAEGVGGPHTGPGTIWPLSIIMRALTSTDSAEIKNCIEMLMRTDAGTGFMHESLDPNNPGKFTRSWFAWCNSLFGEMIATMADQHPDLLSSI
ncbi:MAG TPA: glycoside hydrolase family 125 protein [Acidisarcina sp.]|nr:glycoside hydrolase family 125 protein [Acidisarcina sp.]